MSQVAIGHPLEHVTDPTQRAYDLADGVSGHQQPDDDAGHHHNDQRGAARPVVPAGSLQQDLAGRGLRLGRRIQRRHSLGDDRIGLLDRDPLEGAQVTDIRGGQRIVSRTRE